MKPTLSTVYHVTAFSWYAFVVRSMAAKDGEDLPPGIFVYGGPWKYLTFLNLASTVLLCYRSVCMLDCIGNILELYINGMFMFVYVLVLF